MADQTFIQVRVDDKLKQEATEILDSIGMDMPTAVRMFLKKIVIERGLPFDTKLPSHEFIPAKPAYKIDMQEYIDIVGQIPMGRVAKIKTWKHFSLKQNKWKETLEPEFAKSIKNEPPAVNEVNPKV